MLKIKLKPCGRKKRPYYEIVVMQNLSKHTGKAIEQLGYYDPLKKTIKYKQEKLMQYILEGAQPTNTIRHLLLANIKLK